jgi:hypothetical protein
MMMSYKQSAADQRAAANRSVVDHIERTREALEAARGELAELRESLASTREHMLGTQRFISEAEVFLARSRRQRPEF